MPSRFFRRRGSPSAAAAAFANWSRLTPASLPRARSCGNSWRDVCSRPAKEKVSDCPRKGQQKEFWPLIAFPSARFEAAKRRSNVDDGGRAVRRSLPMVTSQTGRGDRYFLIEYFLKIPPSPLDVFGEAILYLLREPEHACTRVGAPCVSLYDRPARPRRSISPLGGHCSSSK